LKEVKRLLVFFQYIFILSDIFIFGFKVLTKAARYVYLYFAVFGLI